MNVTITIIVRALPIKLGAMNLELTGALLSEQIF
jgi:hypothetical protein